MQAVEMYRELTGMRLAASATAAYATIARQTLHECVNPAGRRASGRRSPRRRAAAGCC
jgi:hypothetical protein